MKVGTLFAADVSNALYRAIWPIDALASLGHELIRGQPEMSWDIDLGRLERCDVVHIYRRADAPALKAAQHLRRRGVAITFDNDDDLRLTPKGTPLYKFTTTLKGRQDAQGVARMRGLADVVTTTTETLAELLRKDVDGPIEIVENFLGDPMYATPRSHDGIVIGWAARREHDYDVRAMRIAEALRAVMERDPRVRVETAGVKLDLPEDRYTWFQNLSIDDLVQTFRGWDLGIAPISDHPMNLARSNVKVKEYAAAGVPWLASARGPYPEVWSPKCGGVLVEDDGWEQAIVDLLGSRFKLKRMKKRAASWGSEQRMALHVRRWEEILELAVEQAQSRLVAAYKN